jgi:hypothetical protein
MEDYDEEWLSFCVDGEIAHGHSASISMNEEPVREEDIPESGPLYISTRTKIGYFNRSIDLNEVFWNIPILPYASQKEGIIKKQIKISIDQKKTEAIEAMEKRLEKERNCEVQDLSKKKEKYIKKISIGVASKDLLSYRTKKRGAFYNCFVLIFRMKVEDGSFKEIHVKVFNTGKIEIPGMKTQWMLDHMIEHILHLFQVSLGMGDSIKLKSNEFETVLVNSNFNCCFNIQRDKLLNILRTKYNICATYDGCSYPGIISKFYYPENAETIGDGVRRSADDSIVTFMIFRTGSVLIVGKCDNHILNQIYEYLKLVLRNEYAEICQHFVPEEKEMPLKKKKPKRHYIMQSLSKSTKCA